MLSIFILIGLGYACGCSIQPNITNVIYNQRQLQIHFDAPFQGTLHSVMLDETPLKWTHNVCDRCNKAAPRYLNLTLSAAPSPYATLHLHTRFSHSAVSYDTVYTFNTTCVKIPLVVTPLMLTLNQKNWVSFMGPFHGTILNVTSTPYIDIKVTHITCEACDMSMPCHMHLYLLGEHYGKAMLNITSTYGTSTTNVTILQQRDEL